MCSPLTQERPQLGWAESRAGAEAQWVLLREKRPSVPLEPGAHRSAQQESPEPHSSQRRDPQWTPRESPVVPSSRGSTPPWRGGAGRCSFFADSWSVSRSGILRGAEGAGLTERASMPAGVFRGKDSEFTLVPNPAARPRSALAGLPSACSASAAQSLLLERLRLAWFRRRKDVYP